MDLRIAWTRTGKPAPPSRPSPREELIARALIIGGGVFVFALFAWGHLGLGAWLVPPAATAQQQSVKAGPYVAALVLESGQFTVGQHNRASIVLRDGSGKAVDGASVHIQPVMTTMQMNVPAAQVVPQGHGTYVVHPSFSMAGTWRLEASITRPGQPAQHLAFEVGVRWP